MTKVDDETYDFLIVGSGFGGSVCAMRLAEKGYKVVVVEEGREYQDQDFPTSNWDLRKYLWLPRLGCHGIQKLQWFSGLLLLSGSGVGGGSLVYANTCLNLGLKCLTIQIGPKKFPGPRNWKNITIWPPACWGEPPILKFIQLMNS